VATALSICYELAGRMEESIHHADLAVEYAPDAATPREQRMQALLVVFERHSSDQRRYETIAHTIIEDATKVIKTRQWDLSRLTASKEVSLDGSVDLSKNINQHRAKLYETYAVRGIALYRMKYTGAACDDFNKAAEIEPSEFLLNFIGRCHRDFGEGKLALQGMHINCISIKNP